MRWSAARASVPVRIYEALFAVRWSGASECTLYLHRSIRSLILYAASHFLWPILRSLRRWIYMAGGGAQPILLHERSRAKSSFTGGGGRSFGCHFCPGGFSRRSVSGVTRD